MALEPAEQIAGVCLAGDSRLTWLASPVPVSADDVVVVEIAGERLIGRVRVPPGAIVAGKVKPTGRVMAVATQEDIQRAEGAREAARERDARIGGAGRLIPPTGDLELQPLLRDFEPGAPRLGGRVRTERGDGVIVGLSRGKEAVTVRLDTGSEVELPANVIAERADVEPEH